MLNLSLFKNKNFSLIVFGQATSVLGTLLLEAALALYVLQLTNSAQKLSLVFIIHAVTIIIIGLISGVVVDKVNKKLFLIIIDLIRGFFSIMVSFYTMKYSLDIGIIFILVFIGSTCSAFFEPTIGTIFPRIVDRDSLSKANTLYGVILDISFALGPLLGALLFGSYGLSIVFLVDGITYLLAAGLLIYLSVGNEPKVKYEQSFIISFSEGIKVIWQNKRILSLVTNDMMNHLFLFPFITVGFPFIIIEVLNAKEYTYGLVQTVATMGSILSIFLIGFADRRYSVEKNISVSFIGNILFALMLLPLINNLFIEFLYGSSFRIVSYLGLVGFTLYILFAFYLVFYTTFYQKIIPENMLGRYVSVQNVLHSLAGLIGVLMFGYLFDKYSISISVFILFLGMLLKLIIHIPFVRETKINGNLRDEKKISQ